VTVTILDRLDRMERAVDDYEMEGRFVWKGGSPSPSSKEGPYCLFVLVVITREMFFSCSSISSISFFLLPFLSTDFLSLVLQAKMNTSPPLLLLQFRSQYTDPYL